MARQRHAWIGYERNARKFAAACACGWRSQWCSSAGLAGAAIDEHLAEVPATEDVRTPVA